MADILIASVRHSGTNFLSRAVGGSRYETDEDSGEPAIRIHLDPKRREQILRLSSGLLTIVPIRNAWHIVASWKARGYDDLSLIPSALSMISDLNNPYLFDVDEKDFDALEDAIGRRVNRDTSVVRRDGDDSPRRTLAQAKKYASEYADIVAKSAEIVDGYYR